MRAILIPCLLAAATLGAQTPDLQAVPLPGSRKGDLALPLIVSKANPSSAARLNAYFQLLFLDGLATPNMKDPFSRVRYGIKHSAWGSTSGLSWSSSDQGRLIAMEVDCETMTAHPSLFINDLLLDALHGQPVSPDDLFSRKGLKILHVRLASLRKAMLRREILSERKGKPIADSEERIATLERALEEQSFDRINGIRLDAESMVFPGSLGLAHAFQAWDVILDVTLPRKELAPYLSAYGKALLDTSLPAPALPKRWADRIFTGKIGTAPIVVHLMCGDDGSVMGSYAYLKQGAAIELSGEERGDAYSLDESNEDGGTTGRLTLQQEGLQLKGVWTSPDGARSLPFTASPE